jgi:hypothetical protein
MATALGCEMFAPLDGLSSAYVGDASSSRMTGGAEGGEPDTGVADDRGSVPDSQGLDGPSAAQADAGDDDVSASPIDAGTGNDAGDGSAPLAPIAFVQIAVATPSGIVRSVSATYAKPQSAGDLNVVAIGWNDTNGVVSGVSDQSGNVYQLAVGPTRISPDLTQAIYYAKNIAAAGAATNVVTVAFVQTANVTDLRAVEYSGLDPVAPLEGASAASGNNAGPAASGSVTTTAARSLLFGAGMTTDVFSAPGSGYTMRVVTADGDLVEDRVVSSLGSYDAQASLGASSRWVLQVAAFH